MTQPLTYLDKVTAFITRPGPAGPELLYFRHPNAGVQLPAGTVEEGETVEQAAWREVYEEAGLTTQLSLVGLIGQRDELPPNATHVILHPTKVYARPDPASFDWAEFRRGLPVRQLRPSGDWAQVTYEEGDRYPGPTYLSYVITGWVPESTLADMNRRHFYHFNLIESVPDTWAKAADNHTFTFFWAPLYQLPEGLTQRAWLDYVLNSLHYRF